MDRELDDLATMEDLAVVHVVFLKNQGEVYAYFPNMLWNLSGDKGCYQHIGQHGACSIDYAKESTVCTGEEYLELKTELETIGYKLKVMNTVLIDSVSYAEALDALPF